MGVRADDLPRSLHGVSWHPRPAGRAGRGEPVGRARKSHSTRLIARADPWIVPCWCGWCG